MDIFCEYIVKKRVSVIDILKLMALASLTLILAYITLLFGSYFLGFGVGLALAAVIIYFAFKFSKEVFVEYEYALTNNELDVDKILGKSRRKHIITVDFKTVDICASINDERFVSEYNNASITNMLDVTGKSENEIYFVDFTTDKGRTRVLFQPTDKMKDGMKLVNSRAINII